MTDGGQPLPRGWHNPLSPAATKENQRQRIVAATIEVLCERGYAGTTVDRIIERARVTKGKFYDHFADRNEGILTALREGGVAEIAREVEITDPDIEGLYRFAQMLIRGRP